MTNPLLTIPTDKCGHMIAGVLIYAVMMLFVPPLMALGAVAIVAVGKEIIDRMDRAHHTPDIWDAIATVALPTLIVAAHYLQGVIHGS